MSLSRAFFLGSVVLLGGCGADVSQPSDFDAASWVRRTGRNSDSESVGLAAFKDGGVVMVGRYYGTVDFGGGNLPSPNNNYQAYVVKYDGEGKHVYSKSFGADFAEAATDVVALADGSVLVTGTFNWEVDFGTGTLTPIGTDVFVLKLDGSGKTVWAQRFGGEGAQRPSAIAATSDGGAVVVGTGNGSFDVGMGDAVDLSNDSFVLRLNAKGEPLWLRTMTSDTGVAANDVAVHQKDGTIAVGGRFNDQMKIADLPDLTAVSYQDGFVAVYDDSGKAKWSRAVGSQGYADTVNALVAATVQGQAMIYVTGQVEGPVDFGGGVLNTADQYDANTFLLELTTAGQHAASRLYGGQSTDGGYDVAVDQEGNVYVVGEYYQRIAFGSVDLVSKGNSDAFVGKVRPNLEPTSQQGWGDTERQTAYRVAVDGTGRVYVAGSVFGNVDFGLGPTYSSGYFDTFLLALPR